jgi:hypothetical protein
MVSSNVSSNRDAANLSIARIIARLSGYRGEPWDLKLPPQREPRGFERRRSDGTIHVTREQITAVLDFVAQSLNVSAPAQDTAAHRCSFSLTTGLHGASPARSPATPVVTAKARGWDRLSKGALLNAAEAASVDLLLTMDRRIRYQQNLTSRKIAIVVLAGTTKPARLSLPG